MKLKSINPYNSQVLEEFQEFSNEQIHQTLIASKQSFSFWRETTIEHRAKLLRNVASVLRSGKENYAKTITLEMGKPLKESIAEVEKCAWVCEYYAEKAGTFLTPEIIETDAQRSYVKFEPIGAILGIMPWNFPFWQVFRFTAPTLMAGNTVLLKHASNVQRSALNIEDVFLKAGYQQGIFQTLIIRSDKIEQIIANPIVKAVTLTGGERAGSIVAGITGENIKKTVLELGGSNAFIVLEDADLDLALKTAINARMQNGGQSCIAAKRFLLHKKIAEEFTQMLHKAIKELKTGNPLDESTNIGPLANVEQANEVAKQVKKSLRKGAKLICGGNQDNAFYEPTLVIDVKPGMSLFEEEVFGPVLPVIEINNLEEAVELSNTSKYGLGVSVFTTNTDRIEKIVSQFDDGAVFINAMVKSDPRLPFGGTKLSGYGRELSRFGLLEFVNIKTVYVNG